jgi:hypothetical protein
MRDGASEAQEHSQDQHLALAFIQLKRLNPFKVYPFCSATGGTGTTNPHDWTKSMAFRPRIYLVAPLDSEGLSTYSTNLYQGVQIFE